jgi:hypothetical protein
MGIHVAVETRLINDAYDLAMDEIRRRKMDNSCNTQIKVLRAILALAKAGQTDPEQLARYATYKCMAS